MSSIPALTLEQITQQGLDPAFQLLPCKMDTPEARVMLLAIGLQESRFAYRRQIIDGQPTGAAKSYWQAERGGGLVHGVRTHPVTRNLAAFLYASRKVKPASDAAIWNAIEFDDVLAAGLARLLLYADPQPLPKLGEAGEAWEMYLRLWRPGRPHRLTWDALYRRALDFVTAREM